MAQAYVGLLCSEAPEGVRLMRYGAALTSVNRRFWSPQTRWHVSAQAAVLIPEVISNWPLSICPNCSSGIQSPASKWWTSRSAFLPGLCPVSLLSRGEPGNAREPYRASGNLRDRPLHQRDILLFSVKRTHAAVIFCFSTTETLMKYFWHLCRISVKCKMLLNKKTLVRLNQRSFLL